MPDMNKLEINGVVYDVRDPTKAPAGYGLGGNSKGTSNIDLDTIVENGFYSTNSQTLNRPFDKNGYMLVVNRNTTDYVTQIYFVYAETNIVLMRERKYTGVWSEWEYVNPPLSLGVEYRTTERYMGKPVYAKAMDIGAMPNSTSKEIFVAENIYVLVRVEGSVGYTGSTTQWAPFTSVSFVSDVTIVGGTSLKVTTSQNASSWQGYPILYYTKVTD